MQSGGCTDLLTFLEKSQDLVLLRLRVTSHLDANSYIAVRIKLRRVDGMDGGFTTI